MREPVLRELDDGVLLVTLNRSEKKNAFDDPQWDGLRDALNAAREDDGVACVVITGAGGNFSAGQDLTAFSGDDPEREDGKPNGYYGCMDALFAFDKPLLAAATGVGVGIGITFLFVTHDQEEALTLSDRIAVMSEGVRGLSGSRNPESVNAASRCS